jgi:GTP pyrophosphokinase
MGRDTLELADDSLFIEKINQTFSEAEADLVGRAHAFFIKNKCADNSAGYRTADLLFEQEADAVSIAASLLAPLLWQNLASTDEIRDHFGPAVAATLENLHPPFTCHDGGRPYRHKDIQEILDTIGGVPRKALLFISFRLLALECATPPCSDAARSMAQETLDLLVPIANRLSMGDLRRRLEDACFRILDPDKYAYLKENVAPIQAEDDKCLKILLDGVQRLLENNGIAGRVQGRTKSLHGIHRKMTRTGRSLQEIMDRVGLRVIVASVPACYTVLGLLHAHFKPIPGTFDDYIGLPKDNGYQSLHTCVYPVREISHKPIEFQVRTELMHMEAEHGTAAHWRYKGASEASDHDRRQAQWMRGLAHQHAEAPSSEAFVELLHRQVFQDHLVVFGNGGRIVRLAERATVRDYLTIANIEAPQGAAVKVNGRTAALDHLLRDGDSIEVLAGDTPDGPLEKEADKSDLPSTPGPAHPYGPDWYDAKLMRPTSRSKAQEN